MFTQAIAFVTYAAKQTFSYCHLAVCEIRLAYVRARVDIFLSTGI